jgi:hypothetical protein
MEPCFRLAAFTERVEAAASLTTFYPSRHRTAVAGRDQKSHTKHDALAARGPS